MWEWNDDEFVHQDDTIITKPLKSFLTKHKSYLI